MTPANLLRDVQRLFLDTAPVIYFVEDNPVYRQRVQAVFELVDAGTLEVVTSPITLSECLVHPFRFQQTEAIDQFRELLLNGPNVTFVVIDQFCRKPATACAVPDADALQVATALAAGCDALLTNDQF
jgi:predicted nucleic acid-binding protein